MNKFRVFLDKVTDNGIIEYQPISDIKIPEPVTTPILINPVRYLLLGDVDYLIGHMTNSSAHIAELAKEGLYRYNNHILHRLVDVVSIKLLLREELKYEEKK